MIDSSDTALVVGCSGWALLPHRWQVSLWCHCSPSDRLLSHSWCSQQIMLPRPGSSLSALKWILQRAWHDSELLEACAPSVSFIRHLEVEGLEGVSLVVVIMKLMLCCWYHHVVFSNNQSIVIGSGAAYIETYSYIITTQWHPTRALLLLVLFSTTHPIPQSLERKHWEKNLASKMKPDAKTTNICTLNTSLYRLSTETRSHPGTDEPTLSLSLSLSAVQGLVVCNAK